MVLVPRFNWEKLGKLFDPHDFPDRPAWMRNYAIAPNTLLLEDRVRVFFGTRPPRDHNNQVTSYLGYVDLDRRNLQNIIGMSNSPVLQLGDRGSFDEFGTYPLTVATNRSEVFGIYAGWTRCESVPFNVGIGGAFSSDGGESFQKIGHGPLIPYSPGEPFVISSPKLRKFGDKFYLFYVAGSKWIRKNGREEIVHRIRGATSLDLRKWERLDRNLVLPGSEHDESQASPDVIYIDEIYHMFFCWWTPSQFRETGHRQIGYAWSKDLINWEREDPTAGIGLSSSGWDQRMVAYPHVFEMDGNVFMLYNGNNVGEHGFGLARLLK